MAKSVLCAECKAEKGNEYKMLSNIFRCNLVCANDDDYSTVTMMGRWR